MRSSYDCRCDMAKCLLGRLNIFDNVHCNLVSSYQNFPFLVLSCDMFVQCYVDFISVFMLRQQARFPGESLLDRLDAGEKLRKVSYGPLKE